MSNLTAATAPVAAVASSTGAATAVSTARQQLGKPYVWAASGPNSFDCSGLTKFCWKAAGVTLPHFAAAQRAMGVSVTQSQLQPGCLVFPYATLDHVQIYVGNGMIIEAAHPGTNIRLVQMWGFAGGACRVDGLPATAGGTTAQNAGLDANPLNGFGIPSLITADVWSALKPTVFTGLGITAGLGLVVAGLVATAKGSA